MRRQRSLLVGPWRRAARAVLALALAAAAFGGCSSRERANPLDPANPTTGGVPPGFVAIALSQQVVLTWRSTPGLSTQLSRRVVGDPSFVTLGSVQPPNQTQFTDLGAANGITYEYQLQYVTVAGPTGLPATAFATPSRVVAWVADAGTGSLIRLSADGREIALVEPGFGEPAHLAVDRGRDLVWIADIGLGRALIYVANLGTRVAVPGFQAPNVVAVDPVDGSAWITDYTGGLVRHVLPSGQPGTPSSISSLTGPLGVDVDPVSRAVWVCERNGNRVRRFASDGTPLATLGFSFPSRVAVDSATSEAWVTSFESARLIHLASDATTLHTVTTLQGPVGVAVDPRGAGRIWVADPVAGEVVALGRDAVVQFRVGGLAGARDLAVELASGEAWVTLPHSVVRIAPNGTVLTTSRGLDAPIAVGLDRVAGP